MMNEKEIYKYNYVLNQLGKRILPQYFYEMNPGKMNQWKNQICRQSHILACYFLDQWLNGDKPNWDIKFYESKFWDPNLDKEYDHSWVYITNWTGPRESYLCDIARVSTHIGFVKATQNNPDSFLVWDKEIQGERKPFNWKELIQQKEYYTHLTGSFIVPAIEQRIKQCNLFIPKNK